MIFAEYKEIIENSILFTEEQKIHYIQKGGFYNQKYWIAITNQIKESEKELEKFPQAGKAREKIKFDKKIKGKKKKN